MKRRNATIALVIILIVILMIAKCNCYTKTVTAVRFVNPPIPSGDIPFSDYAVDASKGDTIMYASGTVLLFPPNSFVDKNGKLIEGKVEIKYREFSNPIDFYLSGIPMGYDSAGVHYNFQSAGMCDIQAFKDGQPVFVNKKSKPEINIATVNTDLAQNLYYFDTVTQQWVNQGKSEIIKVSKSSKPAPIQMVINISQPVKPEKMSDDLPIIKVTVDSASFKELLSYNNLQFQLDKQETRFNPKDSYVDWEDIKLKKGDKSGLYTVKFSKRFGDIIKSVEYKVRPVLSDKDYGNAMLVYDKKMAQYKKNLEAKLLADKGSKQAYIKDSINNSKIDQANEKTARVNKIIEAKNAIIDAQNKNIEQENERIIIENMRNRIVRNFQINGFGVWNCDRPLPFPNSFSVQSEYVDFNGKEIKVHVTNVVVKGQGLLIPMSTSVAKIPKNTESMIIGISEGRFAYITYNELKSLNITEDTKNQKFPMHIVSKENNNYDFIQSVLQL